MKALLDHRNTATTKKLDFKNSHLTSVGATFIYDEHSEQARAPHTIGPMDVLPVCSSDGGQM